MAKVNHATDAATDRDVWQVNDNAFTRIVGTIGMLFIAAAITVLIAQVGGM